MALPPPLIWSKSKRTATFFVKPSLRGLQCVHSVWLDLEANFFGHLPKNPWTPMTDTSRFIQKNCLSFIKLYCNSSMLIIYCLETKSFWSIWRPILSRLQTKWSHIVKVFLLRFCSLALNGDTKTVWNAKFINDLSPRGSEHYSAQKEN